MLEPRPYQQEAIDGVRGEISSGLRRILIVIATGGGKTFTSGKIIEMAISKGKRCIFLAHRKELIDQCSDTLDDLGIDHGVIKSGHPRVDRSKLVQVASIQTLIKRGHWDADLIVIDEAHRSIAKTYVDIVTRYDKDKIVVLGLTATPYRMDGRPLGRVYDKDGIEKSVFGYDSIVEVISPRELVEQGFLIEPTVFAASEPDTSKLKIGSKGDYTDKSNAAAMQKVILHGELLVNWARICGRALGSDTHFTEVPIDDDGNEIQSDLFIKDIPKRKTRTKVLRTDCDACTVIFAPNIPESKRIIKQFQDAGVPAAHVDGDMDDKERTRILKALRNREIYVVSNVNILTEGWDLPHLECVIGARITRSMSLYKQMGGRVMRPDDDKRFGYIIDHANWTRTHGFLCDPCEHTLDGREKRPRKGGGEKPSKECPKCGSLHPIMTKLCEECGYEWPDREIEFTNEDLVELDPSTMKPKAHPIDISIRQLAFEKFALRCMEGGYMPNWARVQYSNKFSEWPSFETGIKIPSFFFKYEQRIAKRQARQRDVQQAANE